MGRGLSELQIKAIRAACAHDRVFMTGPHSHPETSIAFALFGKTGRLTASERVSMSRTLQRLVGRGLVAIHNGMVWPTEKGREENNQRGNG